jgi:hypothetical protein
MHISAREGEYVTVFTPELCNATPNVLSVDLHEK